MLSLLTVCNVVIGLRQIPDKIMKHCIDKLLTDAKESKDTGDRDKNLEQLCKLLDTAGAKLEKKSRKKSKDKADKEWESYFAKLVEYTKLKVT